MHRLFIHNFGPISDAEIDVNRFMVLIGQQSSGKSTIAKLVYYFLNIRDEVTAFIIESAGTVQRRDAIFKLNKRLRNRFVEFFGPTPQPTDICLRYEYTNEWHMEITLDKEWHRYVSPRFSDSMQHEIVNLLEETSKLLKGKQKTPTFLSAVDKIASDRERAAVIAQVRGKCDKLFAYKKELFFIPAGRSLLSTISDQIQNVHPHLLDYPMRQFIDTINSTKVFFDRSLEDLIVERRALTTESVWFSAVRKAQNYVKKILKGEYRYDKEGGKIFVTPHVYTKISYASSGQQESVWILLSLFLLVLQKSRSLVIIEEPEAHLFPDAQKDVIDFVAFVFNDIKCDFIMTTHSPYVLACINNLLYAHQLAKGNLREHIEKIIPDDRWLASNEVSGYYVSDGKVDPMKSDEPPTLRNELLDTVSEKINDEFEQLLACERKIATDAD